MKNLLLMAIILTGLQACAPSKIEDIEHVNSNSAEISTLNNDIEALKIEIEKQKELIKEQQEENNAKLIPVVSNDPDYNRLKANLDEMRDDLIRMIQQMESKLDKRLSGLESKYKAFTNKLDNVENNYVSLSSFESLKVDINKDLEKKQAMYESMKENTIDKVEIEALEEKISEIEQTQSNVLAEYKAYFNKAVSAWDKKFVKYIKANNAKQSKDISKFVKTEIERIKISIEASENKIADMDIEIDDLMNGDSTPQNIPNYDLKIKELKKIIAENEAILSKIKNQAGKANMPKLYSDIIDKQYAPCTENGGLKGTNFCFTFGSLITRLGGVFVDPTNFPNTIKGYLSYLTLSGITINSPFKNYNNYLLPGSGNMRILRACHGNKRKNLLPPQQFWPRGILLSLILQNIEKDLIRQTELGFITNGATPINSLASWYRTQCYQRMMSSSNPNNSDHIYASAFDLSFSGEKSESTFEFYKDYVQTHIWKNDTFEIVHPLKSANMVFAIGIGLGHGSHGKGMFHIGIGSQVDKGKKRRDWGYNDVNGKTYKDLLSKQK
jgi:hypothetical protein